MFSFPIRVYWEDTDGGGVVYHAQYLCFLERARSEWLRARGIEQHGMRESEDVVMAVRSMRIDFDAPARLDDLLESRLRLAGLRKASFEVEQELWRGPACLLRAQVRIACLQASTFKPRAFTPRLLNAIDPERKIND